MVSPVGFGTRDLILTPGIKKAPSFMTPWINEYKHSQSQGPVTGGFIQAVQPDHQST
jgi:hypothetical protein